MGILAGKIGIKPERSPVARLRICFLVLSIVTPIELINRGEQAPAPSHWRPKHPFLSKQKVGWPKVGRSLWQQLKRKRFDSDDRSCVSFVSFKPHTVLKYHSKILMIEWTNYSDTIKVKITEKSSIWSKINTTVQEWKQFLTNFFVLFRHFGWFSNTVWLIQCVQRNVKCFKAYLQIALSHGFNLIKAKLSICSSENWAVMVVDSRKILRIIVSVFIITVAWS